MIRVWLQYWLVIGGSPNSMLDYVALVWQNRIWLFEPTQLVLERLEWPWCRFKEIQISTI